LEDGADAYLSKPFHQKELELCMRKGLELREKLCHYFTTNSTDQKTNLIPFPILKEQNFLQELNLFLESHYAEPLSMSSIAAAVGMNENQLRYKLKALKSITPQKYLSLFRLEKARYFLHHHPELTVKDIGYRTGFTDPAHFSNTFYKEFGQWPSDLRTKQ
jgi:transcriptional regulator GlxA family with amidase domain